MSGHTYTHTYTQDNYSNPGCACAPRVNLIHVKKKDCLRKKKEKETRPMWGSNPRPWD